MVDARGLQNREDAGSNPAAPPLLSCLVVVRPAVAPQHPLRIVEQLLRAGRPARCRNSMTSPSEYARPSICPCEHPQAARPVRWVHDDRCDLHSSTVTRMAEPRMRQQARSREDRRESRPEFSPLPARAGSVSRTRMAPSAPGRPDGYGVRQRLRQPFAHAWPGRLDMQVEPRSGPRFRHENGPTVWAVPLLRSETWRRANSSPTDAVQIGQPRRISPAEGISIGLSIPATFHQRDK